MLCVTPVVMASRPASRSLALALPRVARPSLPSCTQRERLCSADRASRSLFQKPSSVQCTRSYSASATTSSSQSSRDPETKLTWNRFLELRKHRRRYGLAASVVSAAGCVTGGTSMMLSRDLETAIAQMIGLDPMIVMGLSTIGFGAIGWLLGPLFGNAVFNVLYRKWVPDIATVIRHRLQSGVYSDLSSL